MNASLIQTASDESRRSGARIGLLGQFSVRRAERAARARLRQELATYTSQADRDDLNATLDRYDDQTTAAIRDALNTRAA